MTAGERSPADAWLRLAEEDLAMAEFALERAEPLLRGALFHCQQAAENALKSVIAAVGAVPQPTHHLVPLLDRCVARRPELDDRREDALLLTAYAVSPRYPETGEEYTADQAAAALAAARRVLTAVREAPG